MNFKIYHFSFTLKQRKNIILMDELKEINEVREEGNFAVHLAARIDEKRDKIIKEFYTKSKKVNSLLR